MEVIATAGGITTAPEVARITVLRKHVKGEIWFEDVYDNPQYDIAMHAGDRVLVERDPRVFTVLGATGAQSNVAFTMRKMNVLEALGEVSGLDGTVADPTGVFIIRKEGPATASKVLRRPDLQSSTSVIYVLDLTKQNGLPLAQDFLIRDGDNGLRDRGAISAVEQNHPLNYRNSERRSDRRRIATFACPRVSAAVRTMMTSTWSQR